MLTNLQLNNFRLYSERSISFTNNTTVFIGSNAIGKTNILEAVALLSIGKSFRAGKDEEMIKFGEDFGRVKAKIFDENVECQYGYDPVD